MKTSKVNRYSVRRLQLALLIVGGCVSHMTFGTAEPARPGGFPDLMGPLAGIRQKVVEKNRKLLELTNQFAVLSASKEKSDTEIDATKKLLAEASEEKSRLVESNNKLLEDTNTLSGRIAALKAESASKDDLILQKNDAIQSENNKNLMLQEQNKVLTTQLEETKLRETNFKVLGQQQKEDNVKLRDMIGELEKRLAEQAGKIESVEAEESVLRRNSVELEKQVAELKAQLDAAQKGYEEAKKETEAIGLLAGENL